MQQFWRTGYAQTSVDDLVRATGASRSTLYAAFESKDGLFRCALARYDTDWRRRQLAQLAAEHSPVDALRQLFELWVDRATIGRDRRGCLFANTAIELGAGASECGEFVAAAHADTEDFIAERLIAARDHAEVSPSLDIERTAHALLASLLGLLVLIRAGFPAACLRDVANSAFDVLHVNGDVGDTPLGNNQSMRQQK